MAAISEPFRDLAADLFVEEELHAKAAVRAARAGRAEIARRPVALRPLEDEPETEVLKQADR